MLAIPKGLPNNTRVVCFVKIKYKSQTNYREKGVKTYFLSKKEWFIWALGSAHQKHIAREKKFKIIKHSVPSLGFKLSQQKP
jgi:hypothetical protein